MPPAFSGIQELSGAILGLGFTHVRTALSSVRYLRGGSPACRHLLGTVARGIHQVPQGGRCTRSRPHSPDSGKPGGITPAGSWAASPPATPVAGPRPPARSQIEGELCLRAPAPKNLLSLDGSAASTYPPWFYRFARRLAGHLMPGNVMVGISALSRPQIQEPTCLYIWSAH